MLLYDIMNHKRSAIKTKKDVSLQMGLVVTLPCFLLSCLRPESSWALLAIWETEFSPVLDDHKKFVALLKVWVLDTDEVDDDAGSVKDDVDGKGLKENSAV